MLLNFRLSFPVCALECACAYVCWNGSESLGHAREILGLTSLALNMLMGFLFHIVGLSHSLFAPAGTHADFYFSLKL